jgi:hypothetical protein
MIMELKLFLIFFKISVKAEHFSLHHFFFLVVNFGDLFTVNVSRLFFSAVNFDGPFTVNISPRLFFS